MTIYVKGNLRYYELDDYTPARSKQDTLCYLKDIEPHNEVQVFLDNAWCNVWVEHPPKTLDIKVSVQTYSNWAEASQHIDEILRKAGCGLKEDPIISYKISR